MSDRHEIIVRETSLDEFERFSKFSFENFANEMAKSMGKPVSDVVSDLGGPPAEISSEDVWLTILNCKVPIGFIWLRLTDKTGEAFGYDIYLEPEFRSQGIGRLAMMKSQETLKLRGIQRVRICVFAHNHIARALYASLGFREVMFDSGRNQHHLEIVLEALGSLSQSNR